MPECLLGCLRNTITGRWHPVTLQQDDGQDGERRHYSTVDHHPDGFDTRDEAQTFIEGQADDDHVALNRTWLWDGDDISTVDVWYGRK